MISCDERGDQFQAVLRGLQFSKSASTHTALSRKKIIVEKGGRFSIFLIGNAYEIDAKRARTDRARSVNQPYLDSSPLLGVRESERDPLLKR